MTSHRPASARGSAAAPKAAGQRGSRQPPGGGPRQRYAWAQAGDINAFFGLMLDNLAGLILMVGLLSSVFGLPAEFAVRAMVPGTALGVLAGDVAFFFLALRLARRTGRSNVTAMPLGLDTPSTFGMIFFVLGPAFLAARQAGLPVEQAALQTWHIGIGCTVISGLFKLACAPLSGIVRRLVPRAGLLGSLAAIALVLISFLPLLDILQHPLPGFIALAIVLTSLIGRVPLPFRMPGTLAALLVAGTVYYLMLWAEMPGYAVEPAPPTLLMPQQWLQAWSFSWIADLGAALPYLPVALPFALATVVGGIDCTESAAAAGDEYRTETVIAVEAVATLLAGLSGGVIQTTPYIGHPAYKAMGGRAAYTLATALLIGSAGIVGYFGYLYALVPAPAVFPILIFVGLEITAQSFLATPRRHYTAVALACVPALAFLAVSFPNQLLGDPALLAAGIGRDTLAGEDLRHGLRTLTMLANGFIVTSLLWAWALAALIDRRLRLAAGVFATASLCTLFGVIHSPSPVNRLFLPYGPEGWDAWVLSGADRPLVLEYAAGYFAVAVMLSAWAWFDQLRHPATTAPGEEPRDTAEQELGSGTH